MTFHDWRIILGSCAEVLGREWDKGPSDGAKLRQDCETFAQKLNTQDLFERWLKDVKDTKTFNTHVPIFQVARSPQNRTARNLLSVLHEMPREGPEEVKLTCSFRERFTDGRECLRCFRERRGFAQECVGYRDRTQDLPKETFSRRLPAPPIRWRTRVTGRRSW